MLKKAVILIVGCLVLASTVEAAKLGFGARYGYLKNRDTDESTTMPGVQAHLRSQYLGLEGAIDYRSEDMTGGAKLRSWPVSASVLVYPLPAVYALAGGGWYHTTLDFPKDSIFHDKTDTDFGWHVGGGLEVPVSRSVTLTGDIRWIYLDYKFKDLPETVGKVRADSYQLSAGVLFYAP